jgi:hypothetical protein
LFGSSTVGQEKAALNNAGGEKKETKMTFGTGRERTTLKQQGRNRPTPCGEKEVRQS